MSSRSNKPGLGRGRGPISRRGSGSPRPLPGSPTICRKRRQPAQPRGSSWLIPQPFFTVAKRVVAAGRPNRTTVQHYLHFQEGEANGGVHETNFSTKERIRAPGAPTGIPRRSLASAATYYFAPLPDGDRGRRSMTTT